MSSESAAPSTLTLEPTDSGLRVVTGNGRSAELSWQWIRDHGEDPASFNSETAQRRINALGPAPDPASAYRLGSDRLELDWPDDPTQTWISLRTIRSLIDPADPTDPAGPSASAASVATPWAKADQVDSLAWHQVDEILNCDQALRGWLSDLAQWGFAQARGFDGSKTQASALATRIGYVRETIFGGLWDLASDVAAHDDTAYTQSYLAPHTDGTYSHDAPGLQMFCCVERDGTGGESTIVDGMAVALELQHHHPEAFDTLRSVVVPAHYVESGVDLRAARPALRMNPDGSLAQLSLNNYDRSPMLLGSTEMESFYSAYSKLQEMVEEPDRSYQVRLGAGDVLVNDNWRVLHGRRAYTGARRFVGCYLNHEDFESRCRILGIEL